MHEARGDRVLLEAGGRPVHLLDQGHPQGCESLCHEDSSNDSQNDNDPKEAIDRHQVDDRGQQGDGDDRLDDHQTQITMVHLILLTWKTE